MEHSSHPMEEIIIDVLEFFVRKLKRGDCPMSQVNSAYKAITENMDVFATADELSEHFGKSKAAVHGVINRHGTIVRPHRNITHYSFKGFLKAMPSSWRKKHL